MVAYEYRCRSCGDVFEVRRPMVADTAGVQCPDGHDDVSRVWSAVALTGGGGSSVGAAMAAATAPAPSAGGCCGGGCCS